MLCRGNENKSPAADAEQGSSNSQKRPLDKVKSAGQKRKQHRSNGPCRDTSQSEAQSQVQAPLRRIQQDLHVPKPALLSLLEHKSVL